MEREICDDCGEYVDQCLCPPRPRDGHARYLAILAGFLALGTLMASQIGGCVLRERIDNLQNSLNALGAEVRKQ